MWLMSKVLHDAIPQDRPYAHDAISHHHSISPVLSVYSAAVTALATHSSARIPKKTPLALNPVSLTVDA
jgi:hypothetical protein